MFELVFTDDRGYVERFDSDFYPRVGEGIVLTSGKRGRVTEVTINYKSKRIYIKYVCC